MKDYVITISRTFGSGGKRIGLSLQDKLGIRCYNNEIMDMASDESGINKQLFYESNEKVKGHTLAKMLHKIPSNTVIGPEAKTFVSDTNLFNLQAKIIRDLAESESCIIVGRCADYVLKDYDNVFRFFIDAPKDYRVRTVAERMVIDMDEAAKLEARTNKYRKDFYEYYTGQTFGNPLNYDMCFNSERMSWEDIEETISEYLVRKLDSEE